MSNKTPYSQAADAYGKNAVATQLDQRQLEGQILLKAAQKLEELKNTLERGEKPGLEYTEDVLVYNRKLWTVFADETGNDAHPLPLQVKNNIANLSIFVFKRTMEILADPKPEKISALIDINRQIASGLLKRVESPKSEKQKSQTERQPETTDSSV